jgi:acyl carrier protein
MRTARDDARFTERGWILEIQQAVLRILDNALGLKGATAAMNAQSQLLGAIPELDSMAVLSVITALEEQFGFSVDDDEIDGSTFETVGTLTAFVNAKLDP